jgi:hypothetical protein
MNGQRKLNDPIQTLIQGFNSILPVEIGILHEETVATGSTHDDPCDERKSDQTMKGVTNITLGLLVDSLFATKFSLYSKIQFTRIERHKFKRSARRPSR